MKSHIVALCAIFLCLAGIGWLTFQFSTASPASAAVLMVESPTPTVTETSTPTQTHTATHTATATIDPCVSAPNGPKLRAPQDEARYAYDLGELRLRWAKMNCALTYRVKITQDTKKGKVVVYKKGLTSKSFLFRDIEPGHKYFWFVEACNDAGCTKSRVRSFTVAERPAIPPTSQPRLTSTPAANPPSQIANYQGPSVYLDTTEPVYYFDCSWKWRPMVDIVLVIADGFTHGEQVSARAYEISSGVTSMTGDYIAEPNGRVSTAINTSQWAGGHFHLIFTGRSSSVSECGHFDLDHGPPP